MIYRIKIRDKATGASYWIHRQANSKRACIRIVIAMLVEKNLLHEIEIKKVKKVIYNG